MTGGATLPIRRLPREGESFGSYIDRVAADREIPTNLLLHAVGVAPSASAREIPSNYTVLLTEESAARAARVLRLDTERIQQMLLRRYDGVAFDVPRFPEQSDHGTKVFAGRE